MEEASKLCDVVAIMDSGKIIIEGDPENLVSEQGKHRLFFGHDTKPGEEILSDMKNMPGVSDITSSDTGLSVSVSNTADNMEIIKRITSLALRGNVNLAIIKIEEPNLENLFLDLTGRTLRDETGEQ
jgi:ABC-2 type transport system ATP-binding protein